MIQIELGPMNIDVVRKNIKNVHLSVYPPKGRVRISAPNRLDLDTIRIFAISKLNWIRKQQTRFLKQDREAPREYVTREGHYYLGKRYLLKVVHRPIPAEVVLRHDTIELYVRGNASIEQKREVLNEWYRQRLKEIVPKFISKWEKAMKVSVKDFGVKRMKTKWGTCNRNAKRIWINLELAKKPIQCLEYLVVHEMVHLLERGHNERFIALMDKFSPQWRHHREELNRFPVSHAEWSY